jgi:hypothetical protein
MSKQPTELMCFRKICWQEIRWEFKPTALKNKWRSRIEQVDVIDSKYKLMHISPRGFFGRHIGISKIQNTFDTKNMK